MTGYLPAGECPPVRIPDLDHVSQHYGASYISDVLSRWNRPSVRGGSLSLFDDVYANNHVEPPLWACPMDPVSVVSADITDRRLLLDTEFSQISLWKQAADPHPYGMVRSTSSGNHPVVIQPGLGRVKSDETA